ncbi:hypothetical protein E2C01_086028 [Portunus trituberculatus]|uniref:Uncharacterized protein n=1 Tax=Portunus trituberculatus TaxID=210409 RepID=A0A5B7JDI1_PORTR|nr:hypothetical protein [Portunus trituberculatus]
MRPRPHVTQGNDLFSLPDITPRVLSDAGQVRDEVWPQHSCLEVTVTPPRPREHSARETTLL